VKIWYDHGSEHSMNLVMIGHFKDAGSATEAKQLIDQLTEQVRADDQAGLMAVNGNTDSFTAGAGDLLRKAKVYILGPGELEQFGYDFSLRLDGTKIVLTTDESDVSAFLKVLIDNGARVEVYSAHEYPDTEYGR
jgi:hypothetical protein